MNVRQEFEALSRRTTKLQVSVVSVGWLAVALLMLVTIAGSVYDLFMPQSRLIGAWLFVAGMLLSLALNSMMAHVVIAMLPQYQASFRPINNMMYYRQFIVWMGFAIAMMATLCALVFNDGSRMIIAITVFVCLLLPSVYSLAVLSRRY